MMLAVGGYYPSRTKVTETYELTDGRWFLRQNYPVQGFITNPALIVKDDTIYSFGGNDILTYYSIIAKFENNSWVTLSGKLSAARSNHAALLINNKVWIIGGWKSDETYMTEICEFKMDDVSCEGKFDDLSRYKPAAFQVQNSYLDSCL